jgi:hypothetical protein
MSSQPTKQEITDNYNLIKSIYSPYFEEDIIFDRDGLQHLFNSKNNPRPIIEVLSRYDLLEVSTLFLSRKIAPVEYVYRQKSKNYWVEFYSFICSYQNYSGEEFRVKIVIRQKKDKPKHFYSLIKTKHTHFGNKETP